MKRLARVLAAVLLLSACAGRPALGLGTRQDTMNPEHMKWMAGQLQNGRYLYCPKGGHLALYDDQAVYFRGLTEFIHDVDAGRF